MFDLAMNVSLSALERLLQRYTMESTAKPFDVRSVPVEAVTAEQPKGWILDAILIANENDFFFSLMQWARLSALEVREGELNRQRKIFTVVCSVN